MDEIRDPQAADREEQAPGAAPEQEVKPAAPDHTLSPAAAEAAAGATEALAQLQQEGEESAEAAKEREAGVAETEGADRPAGQPEGEPGGTEPAAGTATGAAAESATGGEPVEAGSTGAGGDAAPGDAQGVTATAQAAGTEAGEAAGKPEAGESAEAEGAGAAGAPEAAVAAGAGTQPAATAGAAAGGTAVEARAAMDEQLAPTRLSRGQVVTGTVVQVADDHVLVDVGHKSDGTIPRNELRLLGGKQPDEVYHVGQEIPVVVLGFTDKGEGGLLLSHRRAVEREAWDALRRAYEAGEPIEVPVVEQVKGGLVCDAGVRAFMPASHVERGYVADLSHYVGTTVRAKIIEFDRNKRRVILSRKELLEEEARRRAEETLASLEEGQVRTGVVKGLTDFGAFIDLGGVDGLLHVSEMHWGRIDHPRDLLKEGDTIQVKVLRVDRERGRISLSLKELMPDPWADAEQRYPVGATVKGTVVRLVPFGAFVRLEPGVEGLVHISQLADHRVESPDEVVQEGQQVEVRVLRVQPEDRRISLSMRPPAEPRRPRGDRPRRAPERPQPRAEDATPAADGGGITIGEMFGDLLEETRDRLTGEGTGDQA
ncbi:RNA binding S1 domain protein [Thermaerobacter marianensis DSM 12885]|uniref:RNA binding S1 domain protein n=1 Tax=Thermaerobacter marianensis (strain ATCC 700841 / DSM 12885 / JCM 10246 / 7p75a) TaxID=644966 RepID=E6SKL6_THEM7|nr:30S ribosomal protein S1 [Thermaerobacter marianensis]ADU51224.1 RNA binding S1 domain protein [Thermaerobacter marianensis DSM 12885]